jgi:hypothetical protein
VAMVILAATATATATVKATHTVAATAKQHDEVTE